MVRNLDTGDYTIVAFDLTPKITPNYNGSAYQTSSARNSSRNFQIQQPKNLEVEIDYTDNLGVRRIVDMELPLTLSSGNSSVYGTGTSFSGRRSKKSFWSNWYVIVGIIIIVLVIAFVLYKKHSQKIKKALNNSKNKASKNSSSDQEESPDWIKKAKDKERNR